MIRLIQRQNDGKNTPPPFLSSLSGEAMRLLEAFTASGSSKTAPQHIDCGCDNMLMKFFLGYLPVFPKAGHFPVRVSMTHFHRGSQTFSKS
jgi:hypothetical protein